MNYTIYALIRPIFIEMLTVLSSTPVQEIKMVAVV